MYKHARGFYGAQPLGLGIQGGSEDLRALMVRWLGVNSPRSEVLLRALDEVEDELTAPDPEKTVDPSEATAGERIEGGFTVVRRLGKGSSSDVLLVNADGGTRSLC